MTTPAFSHFSAGIVGGRSSRTRWPSSSGRNAISPSGTRFLSRQAASARGAPRNAANTSRRVKPLDVMVAPENDPGPSIGRAGDPGLAADEGHDEDDDHEAAER